MHETIGYTPRWATRSNWEYPESVIQLFRTATSIFANQGTHTTAISAPYFPKNYPSEFALSFTRSQLVASLSVSTQPAEIRFGTGQNNLALVNVSDEKALSAALDALDYEIREVSRGTTLSTKKIADHRCRELTKLPLWRFETENTKTAKLANKRFLARLRAKDEAFDFWVRWYLAIESGKSNDQFVLNEVSLIRAEIWDSGSKDVADEIQKIEANWLARKLPESNRIAFAENTGKFKIEVKPSVRLNLLAASLSQVDDALNDVLANPSNGIHERSRETVVLRRASSKYGNNPQRIEMDFTSVHAGLTRQIATDELPASEENVALLKALEEGAQGIRATDPEVAENRRILSQQAFAELDENQLTVIAEAQPVLEEISEGELAEDWGEDIPMLLSQDMQFIPPAKLGGAARNPVLAGYNEKVRIFGRAARILVLLKRYPEYVDRIRETTTYKTMDIMTKIAGVVGIGIFLIS